MDTSSGGSTRSSGGTGAGNATGGTTGSGGTMGSGGAQGGTTGSGGTRPLSTGGSGGACTLHDAGRSRPWDPTSQLDAQGYLKPPATDDGFQLASPVVNLDPGQEIYGCVHFAAPVTSEFDVGEWESQQGPGAVELTLFATDDDAASDGTLDRTSCTLGAGAEPWLYSAAAAPLAHLTFPEGVGMSLSARQRLLLDVHFVNTGTDPLHTRVAVNATRASTGCGFQEAQAQVSFNTMINIPVNGTQTVTGACTPAVGAKYFYMTTLTRRRSTDAKIFHVGADGKPLETLVESADWSDPEIRTWQAPSFLTFAPGERYSYDCSYRNDLNTAVTVGNSAETNEVCMTFAYFFPARAAPPTCN